MTNATRRFTRVEYEHLVADGVIAPNERIELIGGLLVARDRQRDTHAVGAEMVFPLAAPISRIAIADLLP